MLRPRQTSHVSAVLLLAQRREKETGEMTAREWARSGAAVMACALAWAAPCMADFVVFSAGGDNTTASIQATVDSFRAALGDPNNGNNAGPLGAGRREINWDGGGATTASPAGTPFNGFLNIRGASFTTPGTGFLQTPLDAPELTGINASYQTTFNTFSPVRIFTPLGSNVTDVTFAVPGTNGAVVATVAGFGAVFTDVDLADSTSLEFFNIGGKSLFTLNVLPGTVADGSLSFLGAIANAGERIARVRITTGNAALGPNDNPGGGVDVVAMDDFIYSEPKAIPEPSSVVLAGLGLLTVAGLGRWRRRRAA
jgi:MYXO-CTERM domain-containing protein